MIGRRPPDKVISYPSCSNPDHRRSMNRTIYANLVMQQGISIQVLYLGMRRICFFSPLTPQKRDVGADRSLITLIFRVLRLILSSRSELAGQQLYPTLRAIRRQISTFIHARGRVDECLFLSFLCKQNHSQISHQSGANHNNLSSISNRHRTILIERGSRSSVNI